ncbi:MAG: undecaprenyl-phosphate glucose phosphotransferase, partial [Sphingobacteriaceae bacterium]
TKGSAVFKQLRSGKNNQPFWCYKLRTMHSDCCASDGQTCKDDRRVTYIGKFLRKTSLDELPQFYNVLIGDMSVVGPRPHMLKHTEEFSNLVDYYMDRHCLKPGITGWAQVKNFRGEIKHRDQLIKRVECDIWYINNRTILVDLKIIIKTILNAVQGEENAY